MMGNYYPSPTGLLWLSEGRAWREEVAAAAAAYQAKFWVTADTCLVKRETITIEDETDVVRVPLNDDFIEVVAGVSVYAREVGLPVRHYFVFNSQVANPRKAGPQGAEGTVGLVQGELF